MRGIDKIDGDIRVWDESEISLDSEEDSSLFKQSHPSTFFATGETSGVSMTKDSVVLKRAYGFCFKNLFIEPLIEPGPGSLTVTYPICHKVHRGHPIDQFKWHITGFNPLNDAKFPIYSHIQLKFTRIDTHIYLNIKCNAFIELHDFDLTNFVAILAEKKNHSFGSSEISEANAKLHDKLMYPDAKRTDVIVRQQVIDDGVDIQSMLESVYNYNVNCLKRFEELTCTREVEAYNVAQQLGVVLNEVVGNYQAVTSKDYLVALTLLDIIEANLTYKNDPQIWMSMTRIRDALNDLARKALNDVTGVRIDVHQLDLIVKELELHEGINPKNGHWFPVGTVASLSQSLTDFFPDYNEYFNPCTLI